MIQHPHQTPDGHTVTKFLDWTGRDGVSHWGGRLKPCRSCEQPTRLLDDRQRPQHKVCAEREAELELARTATIPQRTADSPRPARGRQLREPEPEAEALW